MVSTQSDALAVFSSVLKSWEIITEDEATMYSNQNPQTTVQQSSSDVDTCLAEELNIQLATSGSSVAGQASSGTVRVLLNAGWHVLSNSFYLMSLKSFSTRILLSSLLLTYLKVPWLFNTFW